jgi:hypothetical protein
MQSLLPVSCGEAKEFVRLACEGVVLAGLLASSGRGSLAGPPGTPDLVGSAARRRRASLAGRGSSSVPSPPVHLQFVARPDRHEKAGA